MNHTPGPWKLETHALRNYTDILSNENDLICSLTHERDSAHIDAAHIVHCVNSYDVNQACIEAQAKQLKKLYTERATLLEALLNLVCSSAFNSQVFEKDKESHRAWTLARHALALAEGKEPKS